MKILVTGSAGFIGSTLSQRLLERGDEVIGFDNLNDYYDVNLKRARLARLQRHPGFTEVRANLEERPALTEAFVRHRPQRVVNLAAQVLGVPESEILAGAPTDEHAVELEVADDRRRGVGGDVLAEVDQVAEEVLALAEDDVEMRALVADVAPFLVLLAILMVRPWGLFGTREELDRV